MAQAKGWLPAVSLLEDRLLGQKLHWVMKNFIIGEGALEWLGVREDLVDLIADVCDRIDFESSADHLYTYIWVKVDGVRRAKVGLMASVDAYNVRELRDDILRAVAVAARGTPLEVTCASCTRPATTVIGPNPGVCKSCGAVLDNSLGIGTPLSAPVPRSEAPVIVPPPISRPTPVATAPATVHSAGCGCPRCRFTCVNCGQESDHLSGGEVIMELRSGCWVTVAIAKGLDPLGAAPKLTITVCAKCAEELEGTAALEIRIYLHYDPMGQDACGGLPKKDALIAPEGMRALLEKLGLAHVQIEFNGAKTQGFMISKPGHGGRNLGNVEYMGNRDWLQDLLLELARVSEQIK